MTEVINIQQGRFHRPWWFSRRVQFYALSLLAIATVWWLFGLHVREPSVAVTHAKAKSMLSLDLPPEATNIRVATHSKWMEFSHYLRFEAPPEVCEAYAKSLAIGGTVVSVDPFELPLGTKLIYSDRYSNLAWFDLKLTKTALKAEGTPPISTIWVDVDRGVFYYLRTD